MADSSFGWLAVLLWRAWKYLLHVVTGKCELERICERPSPLHVRSAAISVCLRNSRDPELRRVGKEAGIALDDAVKIITQAKKFPQEDDSSSSSCLTRLRYSLHQITSLNSLRAEVSKLRAEKYCQEDSKHEDTLMEVWSNLCPDVPLEARLTNQWSDIGFQGNNPATDFRGMGLLGLYCLQYFSSEHTALARSVLGSSQHPVVGYPFGIVGINLTSLLYQWLQEGTTDHHCYYWVTGRAITLSDFMESYCYTFYQFNTHWVKAKPANVMAFPAVKDRFAAILKEELTRTPPTLMKIISNE